MDVVIVGQTQVIFDVLWCFIPKPIRLWPTFSSMESFSKVSQAKLFQVTHLSRNVKGREGEDGSNEGFYTVTG